MELFITSLIVPPVKRAGSTIVAATSGSQRMICNVIVHWQALLNLEAFEGMLSMVRPNGQVDDPVQN